MDNMVRKYRNLLATIAEDLNSKESHFILELVQNADDNHYGHGVEPSLSFKLESNRLVVANNEIGFSAENVKALCSAGESSKKNKTGYIGEKGIGFKSVFKVTDAPEIHSNGYHFQFNRSDPTDLLGYVVPHWVESSIPVDQSATTVVLPAKPGREFRPEMLTDLNATLLLFLEKLRQLEVHTGDTTVRHLRKDDGPITTLTTVTTSPDSANVPTRSVYLRTRSVLDMSCIAEPKRENVSTTDLVLAFPLSDEGEAAPIVSCPTYAFLPIWEFGFNFCIQADFVLVSSREGIHEDLTWNVRLRDAIAPAFVSAVEQFKTRPALANSYLKFLPKEGEVIDPFFRPVVEQIIDALKEAECIPVEGGGWRKPSQVLLASTAIHELFPSEDAVTIFGGDYPRPEFDAPEDALERLSCHKLLVSEVLEVFVNHSEWFACKDLQWKARFYAYLATSPSRDAFIEEMKQLPCIPTSDGKMVVPEQVTVFYPLSTKQRYGFEHELTILDRELFEQAVGLAPDVQSLFDCLQVRHDNAFELIRSHILTRHTNEGIAAADQGALLGHVRYIRDKLDRYLAQATATQSEADALSELRRGLFLGTKRNEGGTWYFDRPDVLYLSSDYNPEFNIERLLGEKLPPGKLLSEKYIVKPQGAVSREQVSADLERWRAFFSRIGVHATPKVVRLPSDNVECSGELAELLRAGDQSVRRATLECLDRHWSAYDALTKYHVKTGRYTTTVLLTQFAEQLRATTAPTRRKIAVTLQQSYHDSSEVKDILGGNLVFVDASIHDERFLAACGITYRVDAGACLKRLRQIRDDGGATRDQIRAIYRRLEMLWNSEQHVIKSAFDEEPLIVVGRGDSAAWVLPSSACWRPTNIRFLDARHPPLQSQYVDHSTLFTKLLRVPQELPLDKWVDGLNALGTIEDTSERAEIALSIYRRLSKELGVLAPGSPHASPPSWLARFKNQALFLDHRGTLVSGSSALYFNDAPDFAPLFADIASVSLLAIPHEQLSAVTNLLHKVGISTLSSTLKVEVAPGVEGEMNIALTQKLRDMFMCIARVVYGQSHERFEIAVKENLFDALLTLEVQEVSDLTLDVTLGGVSRRTTGDVARRGNQLLLRGDAPSHVDYVAMEVRKLLRLPQALSDTISRLLISPTVQEAEAFLRVRNISVLPPEEAAALAKGLAAEQYDEGSPNASAEQLRSKLTFGNHQSQPPVQPPAPPTSPTEFTSTPVSDRTTLAPASVGPALQADRSQHINGRQHEPTTAVGRAIPTAAPQITDGGASGELRPTPGLSPSRQQPSSGASASPDVGTTTESERTFVEGDSDASRGASASALAPHHMGNEGYVVGQRQGKRLGKGRPMRTKKGRLLSYAEPVDPSVLQSSSEEAPDSLLDKHKRAVEQAAVKYFLETAAGQWQTLEEMPHENPGFDVRALAFDGREEVIEVKGQGGAWTEEGVALTPTELAKAYSMRDRYWLCVVEYAIDENRRQLSLVRDPFGLTNQFRFDKGWKAMAVTVAVKPRKPEVGMFIVVPGEGRGRIVKVKGSPQFAKLHIALEDGRQVFSKVFNPATMTLSFD